MYENDWNGCTETPGALTVGARLAEPEALGLSHSQLGLSGTAYVAGAVGSALVLETSPTGWAAGGSLRCHPAHPPRGDGGDGFAWDVWSFALFRFLTGVGIGGEYAAINSAVGELVPARARGWVDLTINGSYWLGTAVGGALSGVLLSPEIFPADLGWRRGFALGALLGLVAVFLRRVLPESPRWLVTHGKEAEEKAVVGSIEDGVERSAGSRERAVLRSATA